MKNKEFDLSEILYEKFVSPKLYTNLENLGIKDIYNYNSAYEYIISCEGDHLLGFVNSDVIDNDWDSYKVKALPYDYVEGLLCGLIKKVNDDTDTFCQKLDGIYPYKFVFGDSTEYFKTIEERLLHIIGVFEVTRSQKVNLNEIMTFKIKSYCNEKGINFHNITHTDYDVSTNSVYVFFENIDNPVIFNNSFNMTIYDKDEINKILSGESEVYGEKLKFNGFLNFVFGKYNTMNHYEQHYKGVFENDNYDVTFEYGTVDIYMSDKPQQINIFGINKEKIEINIKKTTPNYLTIYFNGKQ